MSPLFGKADERSPRCGILSCLNPTPRMTVEVGLRKTRKGGFFEEVLEGGDVWVVSRYGKPRGGGAF